MKKIIFTTICLIFLLVNKSYASNDSLVIYNDTLKETNLTTEVEETLLKEDIKTVEQPHIIAESKVNKPKILKLLKKPS